MGFDDGVSALPFMPVAVLPSEVTERFNAGGIGPLVSDAVFSLEQPEYLGVPVFLVPPGPSVELMSLDRTVSQCMNANRLGNGGLSVYAQLNERIVHING